MKMIQKNQAASNIYEEMGNIEIRKDRSIIVLWATVFVFISFLFYFAPSILMTLFSYDIGNTPAEKFMRFIATGFLTTGLFSILLNFFDFIDYVTRRLRSIVVEHTYLRTLSGEIKLRFRKIIDEDLFGKDALRERGSLYYFLDEKLTDLFRAPYRDEFHDNYYFDEYDENLMVQENHTSYTLHRNQATSVKIMWSHVIQKSENTKLTDHLRTMKVEICRDAFEFDRDHALKLEENGGVAKEIRFKPSYDNSYFIEPILINVPNLVGAISTELESSERRIPINFELEITEQMFDDYHDSVVVNIKSDLLIPKKDNLIMLRTTFPTKDLYLSCEFKFGNFQTQTCAFGFGPQVGYKTREKINSAFVDIKEWVLPGHGAVIAWLPVEKEKKKTKKVRAIKNTSKPT